MNEILNIIIVGDLFPVPSNFSAFAKGDIDKLFGDKICHLFKNADLRICNLEGALTDGKDKCIKTGPVVTAPTSTVHTLCSMGIDCCTLANNHITDGGYQGVLDTINTLNKVGIKNIGAGKDENSIHHYINIHLKGINICLYNVCETMYNIPTNNNPGAFLYDEYIVCREIESLSKECDYLIVIYHGGAEKYRFPSPQTRKRFHRMVDSGANMILSQHTHCVGSEEYYKGAYLLYGQGNFLFRSFNNEFTDTGLIIEIELGKNITVKKHLVKAINDTVRYDEKQDFKEFDKRSAFINNEDYMKAQYQQYTLEELHKYLIAYKSKIPGRWLIRRFFPKAYNNYLLTRAYTLTDLLFTLHSLRSEQNRETAIQGLENHLRNQYNTDV